MSFSGPDEWSRVEVRGTGLDDASGCPHYESATAGIERRDDFQRMTRKHSGIGIAIDDFCALEIVDDTCRPSYWRLPSWFYPSGSDSILSYHRNKRHWRRRKPWVYLKTVFPGQEFVFDADGLPEASVWLCEVQVIAGKMGESANPGRSAVSGNRSAAVALIPGRRKTNFPANSYHV